METFYDYFDSHADNGTNITFPYYDYTNTDSKLVPDTEIVLVAAFYSTAFLLGTCGNSLVVFCVAKYKRMQNITNQLLLSLACADLLLTIVCVPIKFAELLSFGWKFGWFLCKFTHYVQVWTMVTSVLTLTVISIERYYAISRPLRAKSLCTTKHARGVIVAIWVSSCVLALPTAFVQEHYAVGLHTKVFWCSKKSSHFVIVYEAYMLLLVFLVPVLVMVPAYCGVCFELWMVTEFSTATTRDKPLINNENTFHIRRAPLNHEMGEVREIITKSHQKEKQIRRQVLNMLVTVVTFFIICWGPLLFYNLMVAAEVVIPYLPSEYPYAKGLNQAFSLMAYANSCVNPIVYGFMSCYFRKSFKQAMSICCLMRSSNYFSYYNQPILANDRSSSIKRTGETGVDKSGKRNNPSTAVDSLSRSPPCSPVSTFPRSV